MITSAKYRKKPVVVEAIKLPNLSDVNGITDVIYWLTKNNAHFSVSEKGISIYTLEGVMLASWDSYIIKGVRGEFYPCRLDIFEETYELETYS